MGQRSDEIKRHIDNKRSELSENLEELEQRVKNTTDWRLQFDKRPMVMLGVAFGAGLLAATLIPSRGRSRKNRTSYSGYASTGASAGTGSYTGSSALSQAYAGSQGYSGSSEGGTWTGSPKQPSATRREMRKAWSMLDDIRASLIALGTSRLKDYLGEAIPGFQDHYSRTAENRSSQQDDRSYSPAYSEPDPSRTGARQERSTQGTYSGTGYSTPGASTHSSNPVQETFSTGSRPASGMEPHTESKPSSKPKQTR